MNQIHAQTAPQAVYEATKLCLVEGLVRRTRGENTSEILGLNMTIEEPVTALNMEIEGRALQRGIGYIEGLSLIGETSIPEALTGRWGVFDNFLDGGVLTGAYGIRAHGALRLICDELRSHPNSRRAVLSIYQTHRDLAAPTTDVPCTLSIQFLQRRTKKHGEALHMFVTMRSNDLYLGLPYDLIQFVMLQAAIAAELGLPIGFYSHNVASAHIYKRHWKSALDIRALADGGDTVDSDHHTVYGANSLAGIGTWARGCLTSNFSQWSTPFEKLLITEIEGL